MSLFAIESGDSAFSNSILIDLVSKIIVENQSSEGKGFPNPYYSAGEVIADSYKFKDRELSTDSFLGCSFHASTIVDMLVRRNQRVPLNVLWKDLSKLLHCEFKPAPMWKFLTWQCEDGDQVDVFYDQPQSWKKLNDQASNHKISNLPNTLADNPFSYFFLICCPHRLGTETNKLIDKIW